ncbi:glycoprotein 3-alpha-L-fucosyltransferase A-like [Ixodes scapularis]|uniref:glycoprotein 3-alpha-L-fucosyltransferase A-like n=1 Tax=Ixodes scapularis TaxID=6945 RepID=UPI001A9D5B31|nr:glycoprotein 3-alpha-L-fucosyltransferase A-like [Ixodes scapularis]
MAYSTLVRRHSRAMRSSSTLRGCLAFALLVSGASLFLFQFRLETQRSLGDAGLPWVKERLRAERLNGSRREGRAERVKRIMERQIFRDEPSANHLHDATPGSLVARRVLPWFMRNGSLRPEPSSKLSRLPRIWPRPDSTGDDRIVEQLMYLPPHYSHLQSGAKDVRLKKIILRGGWHDFLKGQALFLRDKCPVNACEVYSETGDMWTDNSIDAVIFKDHFTARERKPGARHQIWILYLLENPTNTFVRSAGPLINWTATYRKDSVLVTPYEKFVLFDPLVKKRPLNGVNYATNKTKMVAWFVSNCGASNGRLEYAHELQKYVQVDIYGDCGTLKCERHESENCLRMLDRDYRFYLAFENANCKDYITEKLYNALRHYVVPIVMGASSDEYYNAAPANSYIHVDDFASPRDLAWYLRRLSTNDTLYNQYFAWKGTGEFINTYFWCRLCALLHAPPAGAPPPYEDIGQWWKGKGVCAKEPQWPRQLAKSRSRHHESVSVETLEHA